MRFLNYILMTFLCFTLFVNIEALHSEEVPENTRDSSSGQFLNEISLSGDFAIIINAENSYKNPKSNGIRKIRLLYLQSSREWPGKIKASYVARENEHPAQESFYKEVVNMTSDEIFDYWSTREENTSFSKPIALNDLKEVIRTVAKNKGAYTVISLNEVEKMPARVRVLYTFENVK